jgi:hypothetical protein
VGCLAYFDTDSGVSVFRTFRLAFFLSKAPNSRIGLTDETVPGADPFVGKVNDRALDYQKRLLAIYGRKAGEAVRVRRVLGVSNGKIEIVSVAIRGWMAVTSHGLTQRMSLLSAS